MRLTLVVGLAALTLAVGACGEGEPGSASTSAEDPSGGTTMVAALGDSITAGSPLWDPDPVIRDRIGPALDQRSQFEYWAEADRPALGFRNCGVFGERTDQIADRLDSCADEADVLIVQGGINNIAQRLPVADAATDLEAMVRSGKELGLVVAIADVLPWNNGFPTTAGEIDRLNELIAAIAEREDVPLLRFNQTLRRGPANPGLMRERFTDDGDHPSVAGYRRLAERALLPELPAPSAYQPAEAP